MKTMIALEDLLASSSGPPSATTMGFLLSHDTFRAMQLVSKRVRDALYDAIVDLDARDLLGQSDPRFVLRRARRLKRLQLNDMFLGKHELELCLESVVDPRRLESLDLSRCAVTTTRALARFPALKSLSLAGTSVSDCQDISTLKGLRCLNLAGTFVRDVSCLPPALLELDLTGTRVCNLEQLPCRSLQRLSLFYTCVLRLPHTVPLTSLLSIDLHSTEIDSIEPLRSCTQLESVNVSFTRVRDLDPLRQSRATLQEVLLMRSRVASLSALTGMARLQTVDISETRLSDLSALASCPSLTRLNANYSNVDSVAPLRACCMLEEVHLSHTNVADIEPLSSIDNLEYVDLRGTAVVDYSALRTGVTVLFSSSFAIASQEQPRPVMTAAWGFFGSIARQVINRAVSALQPRFWTDDPPTVLL